MSEQNQEFWPLTFAERFGGAELHGDPHIGLEHISPGGYAYPPGDQRRYTDAGWAIWQIISANRKAGLAESRHGERV